MEEPKHKEDPTYKATFMPTHRTQGKIKGVVVYMQAPEAETAVADIRATLSLSAKVHRLVEVVEAKTVIS